MLKFVVASCLAAAAAGQFIDPQNAKILKEQRFNAGDGRFGSAYAQEDGVVFREETGAGGERVGQYSYIGDDGQTYTVKYTAGKDGFRILDGSHVPLGADGLGAAAFNAEEAPAPAPLPAQRVAPAPALAPAAIPDYDYVDAPVDPNFNPFVNPHDPTHRNFQFNSNGANFAPTLPAAATRQQQVSSVPACADCAGVNPFINPFDASHQQPSALVQPAFQPQPAFFPAPTTTPAPRRFFPPGQLKLNRFETGFNFDFASQ